MASSLAQSDALRKFRFTHDRACKTIHVGDCFPAKLNAFTPVSRQEAVQLPEEDDPSENKENIPPPQLHKEGASLGEPKEDPQHDLNKKEGYNGSGKHLSALADQCGLADCDLRHTCAAPVERYSTLPLRHSNRGIHNANQRPTPVSESLHCWSQRDYYHPDRYE